MKFTDPRLVVQEEGNRLFIDIKAYFASGKQSLLFTWIVAWTICGGYVISQYFALQNDQEKIFVIIYAAFWAYFEYKVIYAFRWRKWGKERIEFEEDRMSMTKMIGKRGIPRFYDYDYIKDIGPIKSSDKNFFRAMNSGYWSVGDERLTFEYKGRVVPFGMHLDKKTAQQLVRKVKHEVSERRKN